MILLYLVSQFVSHHEGLLRVPPLEPGHEVVNDEEGVIIRLDQEVESFPVLFPYIS